MDVIIKEIPFSWFDTILSVATVVIAVVSIIFTAASFNLQRIHNRKSVTPLLSIKSGNNTYASSLSITICNQGLGPAILQSLSFVPKSQTMTRSLKKEQGTEIDSLLPFALAAMKKDTCGMYAGMSTIKGVIIEQGESLTLLSIGDAWPKDTYHYNIAMEQLNNASADVNFHITYTDIYDTKKILEFTIPPFELKQGD